MGTRLKLIHELFLLFRCRLLFPDHPEVVPELFRLSGVDDTLRAQQLTLEQFQQLCNAYTQLSANNISDHDCCIENKAPEHTQVNCTSVIVDC